MEEIFAGEKCGLDIYEETSEDNWADCALRKSRMGMIILPIIILITVIIIFIFSDSTSLKVGAVVVGALVIGASAIYHYNYAEKAARIQYRRFQREIQSRLDLGMTRLDAIQDYKKEELEREKMRSTERSSQRSAVTQASGLMAAASMFNRQR